MAKITILGVGNLLLKDEGVGVHVVTRLAKQELPPHIEVIDGGTAALDLIPIIAAAEKMIVVDALQGGGEPGSIYRVNPEDINMPKGHDASLHDTNFLETLELAAKMGYEPDTVIYGVEPAEICYGLGLSAAVAEKVPRIIELIMDEASQSVELEN